MGFTAALWVVTARTPWPAEPAAAPDNVTASIGEVMFSQYVLPFEIASVLLLVALVGAIVLAMREEVRSR
ncbi:MAG: NADH-quinone oxidoreductase subunit J [Limnochordaceae bacterium]|nr:NADH-quinone oxidoreductase subunit J [Limnochordaceae bacterium]